MRGKRLSALSLLTVVTSAAWCVPVSAQAAPRLAEFSSSFCQDVASLYAPPSYLAAHWPTLHSSHPSASQLATLDASLNLVVSNSLSDPAHDAPRQYKTIAINVNAVAEAEWNTAALLNAARHTTPTTLARDGATITAAARAARHDFAALRAPVTQGCGYFNDTATLDSAADFLTERAQNVAYGEDRPLSTPIIDYVVTTYPHLARLVHVDRSGSQITTVQYALASITGTILVCTNAPGYFAEPVAGPC